MIASVCGSKGWGGLSADWATDCIKVTETQIKLARETFSEGSIVPVLKGPEVEVAPLTTSELTELTSLMGSRKPLTNEETLRVRALIKQKKASETVSKEEFILIKPKKEAYEVLMLASFQVSLIYQMFKHHLCVYIYVTCLFNSPCDYFLIVFNTTIC